MFDTIRWEDDAVVLIDQRVLPTREEYVRCRDAAAVAGAIRDMVVRGAPAIGVTAAMGIALGLKQSRAADARALRADMESFAALLAATRPTAVNLFWAIDRMKRRFEELLPEGVEATRIGMEKEARSIHCEDIEMNRRMGAHGEKLLKDGARILTHCNAGALAAVDYGTVMAPLRVAKDAGRRFFVYVSETRPRFQGSRLTAWELAQEGIEHAIIADGASGHFLSRGEVDLVLVGADRIAANGDTANKIGTYEKAVVAKENGVPFYVAAPTSTFDLSLASGAKIPIEERSPQEILHLEGRPTAPKESPARNPAFDVTPARYIMGFVTDAGILRPSQLRALGTTAARRRTSATKARKKR